MKKIRVLAHKWFPGSPNFEAFRPDVELEEIKHGSLSGFSGRDRNNYVCVSQWEQIGDGAGEDQEDAEAGNDFCSSSSSPKSTCANVNNSNNSTDGSLKAPGGNGTAVNPRTFKDKVQALTLALKFPTTHRENSSLDRNRNWKIKGSRFQDGSNSGLNQELDISPNLSRSSPSGNNFLIPPEPENIYRSTTALTASAQDLFPGPSANGNGGETEAEREKENMVRYTEEVSENFPLTGRGGAEEGEQTFGGFRTRSNMISWAIFLSAMAVSTILFFSILAAVLTTKTYSTPAEDEASKEFGEKLAELPILKSIAPSNSDNSARAGADADISTDGDFQVLKESSWPLKDTRMKAENQFKLFLHPGGLATSSSSNPHPVPIVIPIPLFKEAGESAISEGLKVAEQKWEARVALEQDLIAQGFVLKAGSPASTYSIATSWTTGEAELRAIEGFKMDAASQHVAQILNLTKEEAREGIIIKSPSSFVPNPYCPVAPASLIECDTANVYRSYDGTCNNLKHERWGASFEPYRRILLPDYADGIRKPRVGTDGTELPNARKITQRILQDDPTDDPLASSMLVVWAQFVEHDIVSTAQSSGFNGTAIACCKDGKFVKSQHPECMPLLIPPDDSFYSLPSISQSCLNMVRSAPAPICEFGPREQFNQLTAYLDASTLYGSTMNESKAVKSWNPTAYPGRLQHSYIEDGRPLLARSVNLNDGCNQPEHVEKREFCFKSGDKGVNEYIGLTSMNLIWVRQHNLIAEHLVAMNPAWESARVFEESRRIVIAQIQHITYNEFLPVLIGPGLMDAAGIKLLPLGYYEGYDDQVDATISNGFAGSAVHAFNSLMQGVVKMIGPRWKNEDMIQIHKLFYNPFRLYQLGKMDAILRGHAGFPSSKANLHFSPQITEHFFQLTNNTYGLDLPAMDIQRGRDHGLPSYTEWRRVCNLTAVNNFTDLIDIWDVEDIRRVQAVYKSLDDVDLYIGGLAETSLPDAMVGPTFACILADQFLRLRKGDRFWYEGNIQPSPFTPEQLAAIRQTTLAQVLCSNSDDLKLVQPRVMEREFPTRNPRQACFGSEIPSLDYHPWKDPEGEIPRPTTPENLSLHWKIDRQTTTTAAPISQSVSSRNNKSSEAAADSLESLFSDEQEEERFEKEREKDNERPGNLTEIPVTKIPQNKPKSNEGNVNKKLLLDFKRNRAEPASNVSVPATASRQIAKPTPSIVSSKDQIPQSGASIEKENENTQEKLELHKGKDGMTLLEWKEKRSADAGARYRKAHELLLDQNL